MVTGDDSAAKVPSAPATPSRTVRRLLITAIATLLGAGAGLWVFGQSPAILFGVMFGFLVGQTIHGLVYPEPDDRRTLVLEADPRPVGPPPMDPSTDQGEMPARVPGANRSLTLSLGAWVLAIVFLGYVAQAGWLHGEGAGLLFMFIVLPGLALLGLMGGPTASGLARKTLQQIDAGQRPESERRSAQLALNLGRITTIVLFGFLLWLMLKL